MFYFSNEWQIWVWVTVVTSESCRGGGTSPVLTKKKGFALMCQVQEDTAIIGRTSVIQVKVKMLHYLSISWVKLLTKNGETGDR